MKHKTDTLLCVLSVSQISKTHQFSELAFCIIAGKL
nr:MAG TPA: hypothetical protein [Caudoviricetes sp.]